MSSILVNVVVAAVIGACAGLLWYGLTKIAAIQKLFQKFPKWVSIIVVLGLVRFFQLLIMDEFDLRNIFKNSYDQDLTQQCLILKEAYPEPFMVDQLEKIRAYTSAKDPEILRAYLMGLAKAKEADLGKDAIRFDRRPDKQVISEWGHWQSIVTFYEEWERPSLEGRAEYARKKGEVVANLFRQMPDSDYTVSVNGPGSSMLVFHMKKPGIPNAQMRDSLVAGLGSGSAKKYPNSIWAVGFTMLRLEDSEGKGITIKGTPRGAVLPLVQDDFK
jgi:hypothetical protein